LKDSKLVNERNEYFCGARYSQIESRGLPIS
jgi:hypothetical protein